MVDYTLAPGFLVAGPTMPDPRFKESVILLVRHNEDGALGFVVNRAAPLGLRELARMVEEGLPASSRDIDVAEMEDKPLLLGGPVLPNSVWVMFDPTQGRPDDDGVRVARGLTVANSEELFKAFVGGQRGGRFWIVIGYSGWDGGQLEAELATGSWLPLKFDEDLLFDVPLEERWTAALERLGLTPGGFMMGGSGAMA